MNFLGFLVSILCLLFSAVGLLALGIGLYKAVEYIEDKTFAAKKRIEQIIITVSLLHILLLIRNVRILLIIYSLIIQYVFYTLLEVYPNIQPTNINFIIGSIMALVNHFMILLAMSSGKYYVIEMIFSFIVFVWTTPFCFFLSLSANDEAIQVKGRKNTTWIGKYIKKAMNK